MASSSGSGSSGSGSGGGDRRYPNNLEGLLAFCTEQTRAEDAQGSNQEPISEERKQWLQEALESMGGNDPVKVMLENIKIILETEDVEKKEDALENLEMHCEHIDLAMDFHKIGGYNLLTSLLSSEHASIRWRAASLLATLVQNNPYCQKAALDMRMMPVLLKLIDADPDELVKVKALYAVSCLTRECPSALDVFLENDGFSVLMRAMQSGIHKLQIKSCFLLAAICVEQPKCKEILCKMGMVEQLVSLLQLEHSEFHEHLMRALLMLTEDQPLAIVECCRPELQLRKTLQQRVEFLKGSEEFLEELEYSQKLLKDCFGDNPNTESTVER